MLRQQHNLVSLFKLSADLARFSKKNTEKLGHVILIFAVQKVDMSTKKQARKKSGKTDSPL